jgi:ornithine carbamoyltransferase
VDGIILRTFRHAQVEECAAHASVPVINGLSDVHHPCQALADLLTIRERVGRLTGVTIAYVGDGNNVLHSLLQGASLLGAHVAVATPPRYRPDATIWKQARALAARSGSRLSWSADPHEAVRRADVIYTDVWTSMGQERERAARQRAFQKFQVNRR